MASLALRQRRQGIDGETREIIFLNPFAQVDRGSDMHSRSRCRRLNTLMFCEGRHCAAEETCGSVDEPAVDLPWRLPVREPAPAFMGTNVGPASWHAHHVVRSPSFSTSFPALDGSTIGAVTSF
jgi:hypothetical protein